jgi:nicotinamide-nucleotide amidase
MSDPTVELIRELANRGLTIAVAESLTGGGLLAELTRPAGASAAVLGGAVVYATELKHTIVGVDAELLAERGPVDPDVAQQLAIGVRRRFAVDGKDADIGLSTTGVAGPDPQGDAEPGTVYIGVSTEDGTRSIDLHLGGSRSEIRSQTIGRAVAAAAAAIGMEPPSDG